MHRMHDNCCNYTLFSEGKCRGGESPGRGAGFQGSGGRGNYGQVVFFFLRKESSFIRKKF